MTYVFIERLFSQSIRRYDWLTNPIGISWQSVVQFWYYIDNNCQYIIRNKKESFPRAIR